MTAVQGGNFWNGFAAGAISSLAASAWGGNSTEEGFFKENNFAHGTRIVHHGIGFGGNAGMIAFGTIAGGVVYQTCGFRKIKSKRIDNQFKLKNKCNNKDDQSVVFVIFNALNQLKCK